MGELTPPRPAQVPVDDAPPPLAEGVELLGEFPDAALAAPRYLARRADGPGADGVFIACTALPTLPVIEPLEEDLGKPVITANQATMWETLRLSGVATSSMGGRGSLYRRPPGPQPGREAPR